MKLEQRIKTSLGINMTESRKEEIWDKILTLHKGDAPHMRKQNKVKWVYMSAAAAIVILAAVILPITLLQEKAPQGVINTTVDGNKGSEEAASCGDSDSLVFLENVELSEGLVIDVPESLKIMEQIKIDINEEEITKIEAIATAHGWQNIDMSGTDIDGLYFIKSVGIEGEMITEPAGEGEKYGDVTEEHHEQALLFMQQSGLAALLEQKGMALTIDKISYSTLFWNTVDGYKSDGYVRLGLERDKIVADCKIHAVRYSEILEEDTVPLEQAIKNALVVVDIGLKPKPEDNYTAIDAELKYVRGIPMYKLTLKHSETNGEYIAFALAVDESIIKGNDITRKEYEELLELGF